MSRSLMMRSILGIGPGGKADAGLPTPYRRTPPAPPPPMGSMSSEPGEAEEPIPELPDPTPNP